MTLYERGRRYRRLETICTIGAMVLVVLLFVIVWRGI